MMDTDKKHNLWILAINPNKLYYYDFQRCHATAMKVSPRQLKNINSIHAEEKGLCLVYSSGAMAWVDRNSGTIAWTDHYIPNHDATPNQHYHTICDRQGNRWAWAENKAYCYQRGTLRQTSQRRGLGPRGACAARHRPQRTGHARQEGKGVESLAQPPYRLPLVVGQHAAMPLCRRSRRPVDRLLPHGHGRARHTAQPL